MTQTLFTNHRDIGHTFKDEFDENLKHSFGLRIASGYFGTKTIKDYQSKFVRIGRTGECKILIGMAFYGGITSKQKEALENIHNLLRDDNPENGIYISIKPYHGKIYSIEKEQNQNKIYIGSSNFSEEGLLSRHECSALIESEETKTDAQAYLDLLFSDDLAKPLHEVDLTVKTVLSVIAPSTLLTDYIVPNNQVPDTATALGSFDIELRVDAQPSSSLNLYFEKGRKNQAGLYAPRPWYEIEITTNKQDRDNPFYPISHQIKAGKNSRRGEFIAYAKDDDTYYKLDMVVCSDYGKAIFTRAQSGGRETLGKYIKGRLEKAGVLKFGERITSETLNEYGKNFITFIKINNDTYIIEF
jgi:hypothetical protein